MQERVYIVQTPVRDTSRCEKDLTQRLIDTRASQSHSLIYGYGASISQNVIDEAVGQWKKRLRASVKTKDIPLNICLTKPSFFRATNSLMRKTR